jgi:SPP1 family predicted phage head-tail adaptor
MIRRAVEIEDGAGGYDTAWVTVAQPWAEVRGLDGRESVMSSVLQGVSVYRVRARWRGDLKQGDQIRWGDVVMNIKSVSDPDGRREQLVIIADTEGVRAE